MVDDHPNRWVAHRSQSKSLEISTKPRHLPEGIHSRGGESWPSADFIFVKWRERKALKLPAVPLFLKTPIFFASLALYFHHAQWRYSYLVNLASWLCHRRFSKTVLHTSMCSFFSPVAVSSVTSNWDRRSSRLQVHKRSWIQRMTAFVPVIVLIDHSWSFPKSSMEYHSRVSRWSIRPGGEESFLLM